MPRRLQTVERGACLGEQKAAIDHRLDAVHAKGNAHGLKHLSAAHINALHPQTFAQNEQRINGRCETRQYADQPYITARTGRMTGLFEGTRAAHFDHVVDPATIGQLKHTLFPCRVLAIVDGVIGTERARPRKLLIAARSQDDACAMQLRDLQCE